MATPTSELVSTLNFSLEKVKAQIGDTERRMALSPNEHERKSAFRLKEMLIRSCGEGRLPSALEQREGHAQRPGKQKAERETRCERS